MGPDFDAQMLGPCSHPQQVRWESITKTIADVMSCLIVNSPALYNSYGILKMSVPCMIR